MVGVVVSVAVVVWVAVWVEVVVWVAVGVGVGVVVSVAVVVWVAVGVGVGVGVVVSVAVVVWVAVGVGVGVVVSVAVWVVVGVGVVTQTQLLRSMFEASGGRLTLGQILTLSESMKAYLGASYRQRLADLRRELAGESKTIICHQNRKDGHKSETYWEIEDLPKQTVYPEPSEKMAFVIR